MLSNLAGAAVLDRRQGTSPNDKTHSSRLLSFSFECCSSCNKLTHIQRHYCRSDLRKLGQRIVEDGRIRGGSSSAARSGFAAQQAYLLPHNMVERELAGPRQSSISSIAAHWMCVGHASG
jgi:hypothetical protein